MTVALLVVTCGKLEATDAGAETGTAACVTDKDCPGWEHGSAICGRDMVDGCAAATRCILPCTPTAPIAFCDCNGNTVMNACSRTRNTETPIASAGACDGGK